MYSIISSAWQHFQDGPLCFIIGFSLNISSCTSKFLSSLSNGILISRFFSKKCLQLTAHMPLLLFYNLRVLHIDLITSVPPLPIGALMALLSGPSCWYKGDLQPRVWDFAAIYLKLDHWWVQPVVMYHYVESAMLSTAAPCLGMLSPASPLSRNDGF